MSQDGRKRQRSASPLTELRKNAQRRRDRKEKRSKRKKHWKELAQQLRQDYVTLKATSRPPLQNLSQTAMVKRQILLVPGPWHGPEFMSVVATKLEALGYKIHERQFPAVGSSSPPKDLSEDIAALRDLVDLAIDNANDVIVICHSWGGIVTGSGLVGWSKSERAAQGKKGGVVRVGYLSAFMPPMGKSLIDMIGGTYPPWFDLKDPVLYVLDPSIFYNDLPAAEQKHWFAQLQCQNLGVMHAPAAGESWKAIHSSFLMCEEDLAIRLAGQEAMVKAARDAGGTVDVTRIRAGHSPFLSKPNAIVELIRGVSREILKI